MNKVFLVGNLTRDPEGQVTSSGISYCRFSVAVQRRFQNQNGERETDFINVIVWRAQADNCLKFLKKGRKVAVAGSIQTSTYEKEGITRYVTDIVADEVEFLTPKSQSDEEYTPNYDAKPRETKDVKKKTNVSDMIPMEDDDLPF